eukprot:6471191-Amphidinium_carterae.2
MSVATVYRGTLAMVLADQLRKSSVAESESAVPRSSSHGFATQTHHQRREALLRTPAAAKVATPNVAPQWPALLL